MLVLTNAMKLLALTQAVAVGKMLDALVVTLYKNDVTPGPQSVMGDFTPADFTGAAPSSVVVWGAPFINSAGQAEVIGDVKQFTSTDGVTENTIYGYTISVGGVLRFAERFDEPIAIVRGAQAIPLVPRYTYGQ